MPGSRSYKLFLGAALLVAGGLVQGARAAPEAAPQTAKLAPAPLAQTESVLVRTGENWNIRLFNNVVVTPSMVQMDDGTKEMPITIGQTKFTFTLVDPKTPPPKSNEDYQLNTRDWLIKFEGGEARLERPAAEAMSFKPVTLKLADGRDYVLAFPYGYSMTYTSGTILRRQQHRGLVMYRSGSVQQGTLGGQAISLYDANADGLYRPGDDGIAAGALDAKISVFAPIAANIATPGGVFQVRKVAEDGSQIEFVPISDKGNTLAVSYAGTKLEGRIAMVSADGRCSLVASATDKPQALVVLPGQYAIQYGLAYCPELKRSVATIIPGNLRPTAVNGTAAIELGGPFTLDFSVTRQDNRVTISSAAFALRGKAGEQYTNYSWASEPQITLVSGDKSVAVGKMEFG